MGRAHWPIMARPFQKFILAVAFFQAIILGTSFCGGAKASDSAKPLESQNSQKVEKDPDQKTSQLKRIYIQPYKKPQVFIGEERVASSGRLLEKDLGYVEFKKPATAALLTLKGEGLEFSAKVDFANYAGEFLVQKIGSSWVEVGYHATGASPKSARFISNTQVLVPLLTGSGIAVIDIISGEKKELPVPEKYLGMPGFVESLVLKEAGEIWVSKMNSQVHVFGLADLKYKTTITISGNWTKVLLYDASRGRVYASNWLSGDVTIIDAKTKKESGSIKTGGIPRGLLLSGDNKYLYAALYAGDVESKTRGGLVKVDLETSKVTKINVKAGAKRHIVAGPDGKIYVSDMLHAIVEAIDPAGDKVTKTVRVYDKPNTIAISGDGRSLYVSCRGPNNKESYYLKGPEFGKLMAIDLETFKASGEVRGGNQPTGLDVSPDGRYIALTDFLDGRLRVYDAATAFAAIP